MCRRPSATFPTRARQPTANYWGSGHEVQVTSEPLGTPLTQRTIEQGFGGREGSLGIQLKNGETAVFLAGTEGENAPIVGRTFVIITGLPPTRDREFHDQLRPVD
jgi:hypothetical protein